MRALGAREILSIWDEGLGAGHPGSAAAALLSFACPEMSRDELARLPIGRRDRLLIELREHTLGPRLEIRAACPACGEALELDLMSTDLCVEAPPLAEGGERLTSGDLVISFRLPCTDDLDATHADRADARRALLVRCILSVERAGAPCPAADIPDEVLDEVARRMADRDPGADIELALSCAACLHGFTTSFDIASFFLRELGARAERLVQEVHTLARAYGWSEAEVLAVGPRRRQRYLEMAGA